MLLGFAIMVAFVPNIVGAVSPTNWAVMWIISSIIILKTNVEMTAIHIIGLLFLSYVALSLLWSPHGMLQFFQLFALACCFAYASTKKDIRGIVIGLSFGLSVSAIIAILQYFSIDIGIYQITPKPVGLFVNSNIFAETSAMLLILILIYRLWWFIPVTIPGVLVSSRAVIIGLATTFLVWAWSKSKILSIISALIIASLAFIVNPNLSSIDQRFDVWRDTIEGFTLLGHGIGSFEYIFPLYAKHINVLAYHSVNAHNDILQLIFEFGIGAVPLFIMCALLLSVDNEHKYAIIFFIVIGLFGFPLYMALTSFMAAIVAGQLAYHRLANRPLVHGIRPTISDWLAEEERSYYRIGR